MDDKNRVIQQITDELESLKSDRQTEADDCERAGRYIRQAIEAGAFSGPERIKLKSQVNHYLNKSSSNPRYSKDISGWAELRHWLRMAEGLPTDGELEDTFIEDIDLAVSALRADVGSEGSPKPIPSSGEIDLNLIGNKTLTLILSVFDISKPNQKLTQGMIEKKLKSDCPAGIGKDLSTLKKFSVLKNDRDRKGYYPNPDYFHFFEEAKTLLKHHKAAF